MPASPLIEDWARKESVLRAVLDEYGASIDRDAQNWIEQLLDHNELGLAAEALRENIKGPCSPLDQLLEQMA